MLRPRYAILTIALLFTGCDHNELVVPGSWSPLMPVDDFTHNSGIPGIIVSFRITDSVGADKKFFTSSEPVYFRYKLINQTLNNQAFTMGSTHPFARFFIMQGQDTLADSFAGKAFATVVVGGRLERGDSLTASWRVDPVETGLPPGAYMATASSAFLLLNLGVPRDDWRVFDITP